MISKRQAYAAFAVFLVAFSVFKYTSALPDGFSIQYMISVCILVVLTGVVPFVLASLVGKRLASTGMRWTATFGVAVATCCLGYAAYWALFIQPSGAEVPVLAVALRGLIAGPIEGLLAGLVVTARDA
jgi:hypothetical protein